MSTATIYNFINAKVNNNPVLKERMTQMLNFSNWDDLEAINLIFPFLTSYNSELILLTYTEQDILRTPTSLEYRKGVFNNLGGWMKTVYSLYPKNIQNGELNQERIRLFTVVRQACISKITIIRNTTVSDNIHDNSELETANNKIKELEKQIQNLQNQANKEILENNIKLEPTLNFYETFYKEGGVLLNCYNTENLEGMKTSLTKLNKLDQQFINNKI